MRQIRRTIRNILPVYLRNILSEKLVNWRAQKLARMTPSEAFDEIYRKKMWQQGESLSGSGSEGKWSDDYVRTVREYITRHKCKIIVDFGCGDFKVGSRLADLSSKYLAFDISKEIILRNRTEYEHLTNVMFSNQDITKDSIPKCDLLLVRQVFQHLTNEQISQALSNIENSTVGHVLITEHTYKPGPAFAANIDMKSHSVRTRVSNKSGVDIGAPPFSRPREIVAVFEPGVENLAEANSVLCVYRLTGTKQ